jgi:hypothetical protein
VTTRPLLRDHGAREADVQPDARSEFAEQHRAFGGPEPHRCAPGKRGPAVSAPSREAAGTAARPRIAPSPRSPSISRSYSSITTQRRRSWSSRASPAAFHPASPPRSSPGVSSPATHIRLRSASQSSSATASTVRSISTLASTTTATLRRTRPRSRVPLAARWICAAAAWSWPASWCSSVASTASVAFYENVAESEEWGVGLRAARGPARRRRRGRPRLVRIVPETYHRQVLVIAYTTSKL